MAIIDLRIYKGFDRENRLGNFQLLFTVKSLINSQIYHRHEIANTKIMKFAIGAMLNLNMRLEVSYDAN